MAKLVGRTSSVASTVNFVRPTMAEFITLIAQFCRAELTTHCDERGAVAKFSEPSVCDKVPKGSTLIFGEWRYPNFLTMGAG